MAKKSKFLKNLLTTASALAVMTGGVQGAYALDTISTLAGVARLSVGADWQQGAANAVPAVGAGNTVFFGKAQNMAFDAAVGNLGTLNAFGWTQTVTVTAINPLQGVVNDISAAAQAAAAVAHNGALGAGVGGNMGGVGAGARVNFDIAYDAGAQEFLGDGAVAADGVTVTTNPLSGLGAVTLSHNAAVLKLSGNNVLLGGTIDSKGGHGKGVVEVNATNVQFGVDIGATSGIGKLKLNANKSAILKGHASFSDVVGAAGIEIGNGATLTVETGKNLVAFDTNNAVLSIDAANAGNGILRFQGASVVSIAVGTGAKLATVEINNGTVEFQGSANNGGENLKATTFLLNHANAKMSLSTLAHTIVGDIKATNAGEGKVFIADGFSHEITGNIGEADKAIDEVRFAAGANAQTLTIKGATVINTLNGVMSDTAGAGGKIDIQTAALSLKSNFGTDANHLSEFKITNNGAGGAATVTLEANKNIFVDKFISDAGQANVFVMQAGSGVEVVHADGLKLNNAGSILKFAGDGATVTGAVESSGGAVTGIIQVEADATITGNAGTTGVANSRLKSITFMTNDNKTLTIGGHVATENGVIFSKDSTLKFVGDVNHTLGGSVFILDAANTGVAGGLGKIIIDENVTNARTINLGVIGDHTSDIKVLKLIDVQGAAKLTFYDASVNVKKIRFGGAAELILNKAGGNFRIGELELATNGGKLTVNENGTLVGNAAGAPVVNFGTANGSKLTAVDFSADKTLIIGDGVNIYATALTTTVGNNNGALEFAGTNTFDAKMLVGGAIKTIKTTGIAGKVATVISDALLAGDIEIGAGTLAFGANVTAANIKGTVDGAGTLKFVNSADATVTGTVGAANKVKDIEFAGTGKLTFINKITQHGTGSLIFSGATATQVTLEATTDIGANAIVNTSAGEIKHVLVTPKTLDTNFTKSVGGAAKKPIEVRFTSAANDAVAKIQVAGLDNLFLTTGTNSKNKVEFTIVNGVVGGIGKVGERMENVKFSFDGSVLGGTFADTVDVVTGKKAKFGGVLSSNQVKLGGIDSGARFIDGATLDSIITTTAPGEGLVDFEGNAAINAAIGVSGASVKLVKFYGDATKTAKLSKDIYSVDIDAGATRLAAIDNVTLNGKTVATNFDLSDKAMTFDNGSLKIVGAADITVTSSGSPDSSSMSGGKIVAANATTVDLSTMTGLTITVDDSKAGRPTKAGRHFTLLEKGTGAITPTAAGVKTLVKGKNLLVKWKAEVGDTGNIVLTQSDDAKNVLNKNFTTDAARRNIDAMLSSPGIYDELAGMQTVEAQDDLGKRLIATDVGYVLSDITTGIGANLAMHMGSLTTGGTPVQSHASAETTGVSAGDDANRYGVWLSPFFNKSVQKARKGAAGYAATSAGASFGFDTKANDDLIIGAALSLLNTHVKHKDLKSGDKTKIDSLMFSVYGMQQITNNWFAQALVTFGSNRVSTNEKRRTGDAISQQAAGKYTSMSFSGEALVGYNYVMEQVSITPMGGLRLTRVNDGGYKESGTTNQNLTISKKASNKAELILGAKVAGGAFDLNGLSVTPEIHGFVNQDLIAKSAKIDMRLENGTLLPDSRTGKPNRTVFNAGVGLNATYNSMEYGLGYDAHMANKFVAHQGTLKVRVNF